jgi:acyl-coenzyme A thioesterase PaaI-like protein
MTADSALGCAIQTTMPAARADTTAELHAGRQLVTAEGRIVGPVGKLCAHATTTCPVFEVPAETKS